MRIVLLSCILLSIVLGDNNQFDDTSDEVRRKSESISIDKKKITDSKNTIEYNEDIDRKVSEFLSSSSITSLPVHSVTVRNSSCPNVMEEEVKYRLDILDLDNQETSVFLPVVNVDDKIYGSSWFLPDNHAVNGTIFIRPYLNCLDQESEALADIIKNDILIPQDNLEYNFSAPLEMGGEGNQPLDIDRLVFGGKIKNGFFIEAGSQDAETHSNTLHFELNQGWTGLLVEAHPLFFAEGLLRHRKVTSVQTCLSTTTTPSTMEFDMFGSIREEGNGKALAMAGLVQTPGKDTVQMQCLPLYSLLLAMGNPTVHYFSLDIEGAELAVLKTIPWDKVDIKVLTVETHLAGKVFPGTREDILEFMDSVGYELFDVRMGDGVQTKDDVFVKKGMEVMKGNKQDKDKQIKEELAEERKDEL